MMAKIQFGLIILLMMVTGSLGMPDRKPHPNVDSDHIQPQPVPEQNRNVKETLVTVSQESTEQPAGAEGLSCPHQQHQLNALRDLLLPLRFGQSDEVHLGADAVTPFGICSDSESVLSSQSLLSELHETLFKKSDDPELWYSKTVHWEITDEGKYKITLHFVNPPKSKQHKQTTVLLIFFVESRNTENLILKCTSNTLQPTTQSACVGKDTNLLLLTASYPEGFWHDPQLSIVLEIQNEGQKINVSTLQALMERRNTGCNSALSPVLFFLNQNSGHGGVPPLKSTSLFLYKLKIFLNKVLPQENSVWFQDGATEVQHNVLHSLPPLILGSSTSESLLQELVNSSGPTVFSFPQGSQEFKSHRVELSLKPPLVSVLKKRLHEALDQVRKDKAGQRLMDELEVLSVLAELPEDEKVWEAGLDNPHEVQYRALLLLKALQSVQSIWAVERAQRTTRADQDIPPKPTLCNLQSFTVSLSKFLLQPSTAVINNCEGACSFPLSNSNNHAILLNSHLQSGMPLNRMLCCVPVEYDDLCVIDLSGDSTVISYKTNMVAKECGCR